MEPTVEPVVEPGTRMAEALVTVMESKTETVEEGVTVSIEIVNSEKVMNEEEKSTFDTLNYVDQMMVLMRVLQYDGEADFAEDSMDVEMSAEAQALVETMVARFDAMTEEEKTEYMAVLAAAFPTTEAEIDGVICEVVIIVLEVKVDDEVTYEQYTFRHDEETGKWLFVSMEIVDKPAEPEVVETTETVEPAEEIAA